MKIYKNLVIITSLLLHIQSTQALHQGITNSIGGYVGDCIASLSLAKVLSIKYNIPFYYTNFPHASIFSFFHTEKPCGNIPFKHTIRVITEEDIINNLYKDDVLFLTDILTKVDAIPPHCIESLKLSLQLGNHKELALLVNQIPQDKFTVAIHIRKGNGGGEHYDGEQTSLQLFDFDRSQVTYIPAYNYPFDWESNTRLPREIDKVDAWQTKFPPEQYYVDQLLKIYDELNQLPLYVQIFTDDKNPLELVERIKQTINKSNITLHYENNTMLSYHDRIE